MTAPTNPHNIFNGNSLKARLIGASDDAMVSIQASMNSCVNVLALNPLDRVLFDSISSSSWVM